MRRRRTAPRCRSNSRRRRSPARRYAPVRVHRPAPSARRPRRSRSLVSRAAFLCVRIPAFPSPFLRLREPYIAIEYWCPNPKFASEAAAKVYELRNRDTSAPNPKFAHVVLQGRLRTSGSKGAQNPRVASVPLIPKFASEAAAKVYELRNRDTSRHADPAYEKATSWNGATKWRS